MEIASEIRHEYRDGEIIAVANNTPHHNRLCGAFYALLWMQLRGKPYTVFITGQRLWIPAGNVYTYPDIMIVGQPIELQEGRQDTVVNPIVIAEVLSDTTAAYDRGDKFALYRTINTLQEYLLIDQYRVSVEHYRKTAPNQWLFSVHQAKDETVTIASVDVEIELNELYEGIL